MLRQLLFQVIHLRINLQFAQQFILLFLSPSQNVTLNPGNKLVN